HALSIPEGRSVSNLASPISISTSVGSAPWPPIRNTGPGSARSSRRSASATTSISPAHAFLTGLTRADPEPSPDDPKPDDEGQEIGPDDDRWVVGRTISRGGFGVVKEVQSISAAGVPIARAVKVVRKAIPDRSASENERAQQSLEHEVSVWRHLIHHHILRLRTVHETEYATYCFMDLVVGGTLHDVVIQSRQAVGGGLSPDTARLYSYQLASALRYLHQDVRVCHRDIKLENCLVDRSGSEVRLLLCDFGLADFIDNVPGDKSYQALKHAAAEMGKPTTSSVIGTLEYASPRGLSVRRKLFETAGDMWAFGIVVYTLCTGDLPFRGPFPAATVERIMRADWDETILRAAVEQGGGVADEVVELTKGCLELDMEKRLDIGHALQCAWFK
ncbi:kinase-like protein, partial [Piedraia hortae CBS 480.64]